MSISVILTSNPRPSIWQKLGQMGAPVEGRGGGGGGGPGGLIYLPVASSCTERLKLVRRWGENGVKMSIQLPPAWKSSQVMLPKVLRY